MRCPKFELLKELNFLVRALNNFDKSPREGKFGVCKIIIKNLTDYFFVILDLGTASFVNGYMFTELKENSPLIERLGLMYVDFDEYPGYSGRISVIIEKNVNENIRCDMD